MAKLQGYFSWLDSIDSILLDSATSYTMVVSFRKSFVAEWPRRNFEHQRDQGTPHDCS